MSPAQKKITVEIIILAGGLSSRMGRDKSRLRLGRRTLLGHVRAIAAQLHLPVRILRRDALPRCGPLGGIYTALARSRADALLFLACDMPFVSVAFLNAMIKTFRRSMNSRKIPRRTSSLPLPRGEGRGEGKAIMLTPKNVPLVPALFASHQRLLGLPCLLHRESALPIVSRHIAESDLSLQSLARALKAKSLRPGNAALQLININTPDEFAAARSFLP